MKLLSRSRRAVQRLPIRPRRMNFRFKGLENTRYWFDDDPVLTHFMNVLSVTFPDGERFFVDAVRAFRDPPWGICTPVISRWSRKRWA